MIPSYAFALISFPLMLDCSYRHDLPPSTYRHDLPPSTYRHDLPPYIWIKGNEGLQAKLDLKLGLSLTILIFKPVNIAPFIACFYRCTCSSNKLKYSDLKDKVNISGKLSKS